MINHYLSIEMTERKRLNYYGILQYHLKTCTDISCFCKKKDVFDATKNKKTDIDLEYSLFISSFYDPLYLKNILTTYLKRFVESNKTSLEAHTYYAEFLFKECQNVFAAHYQLSLVKTDAMPLRLKFKQFFLKKVIKHEVNPNEVGNKR